MEVILPLTPTSCVNYKAFLESSQDETENLLCRACRGLAEPELLVQRNAKLLSCLEVIPLEVVDLADLSHKPLHIP